MDTLERSDEEQHESRAACTHRRNLIGFWLLGLCNNYAYVIMLSAADDILDKEWGTNMTHNQTVLNTTAELQQTHRLVSQCNEIGTGAILLADILPTLFIKITGSLYVYIIPYSVRVLLVVLCTAASFPIVSFSSAVWMSLLGVIFASMSAGLGEMSFLALTAFFQRNTVSTWSSGTGAAGLFGSLSYAGMTTAGVTPRTTLLIMLVIPALMLISYFVLLVRPRDIQSCVESRRNSQLDPLINKSVEIQSIEMTSLSFVERIHLVRPLLKYMIPLCIVYIAEYVINQALFELIVFDITWLSKAGQYRWYQVIYQVGVFASRSSVNLVSFKRIWIFTLLQFINVALFLLQIFTHIIPNIWCIFVLIFYEGLLGGCAYVNTFYKITNEVAAERKEYSMTMVTTADAFGIAIAGMISIPLHNYLCTL